MSSPNLTVLFLLATLVAVLLVSLVLALRDRVAARIGLRNFFRGRTRTVILIVGLLVGATIISSSLVIGDTVTTLSTHFVYITDGPTHEAVYAPGSAGLLYAPFPAAFATRLSQNVSTIPHVRGVSPFLVGIGAVSGLDRTSGIPQALMNLMGTDPNSSAVLGDFVALNGTSLPGPTASGALLDPTAAQDLNAQAGDLLSLHSVSRSTGKPTTLNLTVLAVVQATPRGGFMDNGEGDVFVTLPDAQALLGLPGSVNYIAVTNTGGLEGGLSATDSVWAALNQTVPAVVASFPANSLPPGIAPHAVLLPDVVSAQSSTSSLTTLFLVIGLFSIVSGAILVVGIFVLLSEERRGTMGVARAIGMTRWQLVKSYYFEGLAYSVGSAALGTFLGVGVAYLLLQIFAATFVGGGLTTLAVEQSFTVLPASLLTAYVVGFLLTLGTVVITVAYVSRLNIVRAIRSLPEPPLRRKSYRRIAAGGGLLLVLGLVLLHYGLASGVDEDVGLLGVSLAIMGAGLIFTVAVPNRYVFTAMGLALIGFWSDEPLHQTIFGAHHPGTIFVFFQEGVFLILGAILLYLSNSDLVVRGISALVRRAPRQVPVVKVALSYPGQKRFRTSMTLAIFAMVMFTIVTVASIGSGITANVGHIVQTESGGYTLAAYSSQSIPDLYGAIQNNSTLAPEVRNAVSLYSLPYPELATANLTQDPHLGLPVNLAAAPDNVSGPQNFYSTNQYNFTETLHGMSGAQVWRELQDDPHVAVISLSYLTSSFNFGPASLGLLLGQNITLSVPGGSAAVTVTIIGVLSEEFLSVVLVNPTVMTQTLGVRTQALFLITTTPGADPQSTIYHLKSAFLADGLQVIDFAQTLESAFSFILAFLDLLEIFVALGLAVGIAAIGILALRAVVERKNEIGMLRAVGFRKSQVLAAFLLEYSFLALLGIGIGAALGILLSYNLSLVASGIFAFAPPWTNLALVILLAYGLTLLATGGPSYRASRLPPAEALRYTE